MKDSFSESYKAAGVDITAGYASVNLMKPHVIRTRTDGVLDGAGGFGGLFAPDFAGMEKPVLVSGTDGVGTKLKLAFLLDRHDTVGVDLVAMCANDIVCCGAKPLFFLDYINCGRNVPEKIAAIVKGVADGCVKAGCALIGGETAEHPGLTPDGEYDLAGFCAGIVDEKNIIDGSEVREGDALIGLASSGAHSNGFSLVRKVFGLDAAGAADALNAVVPETGKTLGETLLTPTEIYVKPVLALIEKVKVKGIAHITGGGFYENLPRCIPKTLTAEIHKGSYEVPAVFDLIAKRGQIPERDMYNTFNMGAGMVCVVGESDADAAVGVLGENGVKAFRVGKIIKGEELKII
ncbi:MAG: phosphoribosylformylglycinamidine cyclo-ligase [Oscillospiraceae bacterium]|jgi:phosphoribosylformylglycinamidine cyclo-ligase|nr:phosphoribosylformylglycinamidine cyclo-ligase [Oscillospiraceae bacterium]